MKQIVTSDLRRLLGAEGEPAFVKYILFSALGNGLACASFMLTLMACGKLVAVISTGAKHFPCMGETMNQY